MFRSTNFNRTIICIAITLVFILHGLGRIEIPLLNKIEHSVYDLRLKLTTVNTIDPRIVILDLDEKSLAVEGRWPWSRDKLSELVEILFSVYQIKILGFDIVFAEADTSSGLEILEKLEQTQLSNNPAYSQAIKEIKPSLRYDNLFANSLSNRAVVLGYYFNTAEKNINPNSSLPLAAAKLTDHPNLRLVNEQGYGANLAILQNAAITGGYFNNSNVDIDGSYRRIPLVAEFKGNIYESLALATYRRLLGQPPLEFTFQQGYGELPRLESIDIESLSIPVNEYATALVPYRGKQGSFNYISATDVLSGEVDFDQLTDKIVLFGATAAGLLDLRTTPVQNVYPGVEVHANLISGMLDQSFKSKPSFMLGAELVELVLLALFVVVVYPKLSSISAATIFALLIAFMLWSNLYLWQQMNIDNFLATPLILLFVLFSVQIYFGYFLETKKKNKLGKIFGQYIPAELVADMSQSEHEFSLKAQLKQMTVLFSDVRGFTSISEGLDPESLAELINEILTPITGVIHHHHGTIDKYIGDAIMAFWAAPLDDKDHASHAVQSALAFIPVLEKINQAFKLKDWPYIDMGIGINTGNMSVGNMGSEFRMAYTVMGDAVNIGARLEGLTKQYGLRVLVSEATKNAAPEYSYLEVDRVRVKGKLEPLIIYEPLGLSTELSEQQHQLITDFQSVLEFYRAQQWQQAKLNLEQLEQQYPDKVLFKLYLDRIEHHNAIPLQQDWDGVFTHTSK